MRRSLILWTTLLLLPHVALSDEEKRELARSVAPLLEDNAEELLPKLTNPTGCPGEGHVEKVEAFAGSSCIRIVPMQRYEPGIPGWEYRIREEPKPGEFRYLRFAWKCRGCTGIMLQMHDLTDWHIRYTAGANKHGWMTQFVSEKPPEAWTLVTVDLFKDFGERTIRGIALTCFDGEAGYFDHIYLGRSVVDLDRIDATGLADAPPRVWTAAELEEKWEEVSSQDAAAAYRGFWTLVHAKATPEFLADKLKAMQEKTGAASVKKWLAELDDDDFAIREKANEKLANALDTAAELLEEELARTKSVEVKFRIKNLLAKRVAVGPGAAGMGQSDRAIRILEFSRTAAAKEVLAKLASGDESDRIVKAAKEALKRQEK